MFTKRMRVISVLTTVCMLISMLACFALPIGAEEGFSTGYTGELVSETGLADVRKLDDIKDGLQTDVFEYQVTDRAGFEKINSLVMGGNNLSGYTFTMANDIDFEWKNFTGIGACGATKADTVVSYPFSGTFDGNGFVVENLLISAPYSWQVGLFGTTATATVKNLGIASGLIVGGDRTGALVGFGTQTTIYNCWSAATVVATGDDAGVFVGALNSGTASKMFNCYNLGMGVFSSYGGMMYGTAHTNYLISVKNSYNYGVMVADIRKASGQMEYSSFGRTRKNAGSFTDTANNAAVDQALPITTGYEHITAGGTVTAANDQAVEYSKDEFTGTEVLTRLNTSMDTSANPAGYTVGYETVEGVDYPVLTYYKDGAAVIRRVAHTADNIGENTLAEESDLFADYSANPQLFGADASKDMGDITIDNAADLVALSFMMAASRGAGIGSERRLDGLGITKITFTADIDMKDFPLFKGADGKCGLNSFIPIGAGEGSDTNSYTNTSINVPVVGGGHVVRNWCSYNYTGTYNFTSNTAYCSDTIGSLFVKLDGNASITDLGMENATAEFDVRESQHSSQHTRYALMVGKLVPDVDVTQGATINNCWATGTIKVHRIGGSTSVSTQDFGGLIARDISNDSTDGSIIENCWVDVDVENAVYPTYTKATVIGVNGNVDQMNKNLYFADEDDVMIGVAAMIEDQTKLAPVASAGERAWVLNQQGLSDSTGAAAYYKADTNGLAWATAETATHRVSIVKMNANNTAQIGETEYLYVNAGTAFTAPAYEGYELKTEVAATMPAEDLTLTYQAAGFDFVNAEEVYNDYKDLEPAYFDGELTAGLEALEAILDQKGDSAADYDTLTAAFEAAVAKLEAIELKVNSTAVTKANYTTIVPNYTDAALYSKYNTAEVWGVETKDDWIALTEADEAVANAKIYLKANIDMGETNVEPLCNGFAFNGTLNGMGHYFENLLIRHAAANGNDGAALISSVGSAAYIADLGVKSGLIELTNQTSSDNWYGVAVFAGRSGTASVTETSAAPTFYKCWAGKDVKIKAYSNGVDTGYSTFVGRGGAHIESCYSLATLENQVLVYGALSGWTQLNTTIRNSYTVFNGVTPVHSFELARSGKTTAQNRLENSYGLGDGVVCKNNADMVGNNFAILEKDIYGGELAYTLNQNYAADRGEGAVVPERVYWTVDANGDVVFGTDKNQTRKLTITATPSGQVFEAYGEAGDTVDLLALLGNISVAFTALEDNVGIVENNVFTFGAGDGNLTAELQHGIDGDYLYLNGVKQLCYQLVEFEGDYYFINDNNKIAKNARLYISDIFVEGTGLEAKVYDFDSEGRMITGSGPHGDYFYINGTRQKRYQVLEHEGNYYYIGDYDKIVRSTRLYFSPELLAATTLSAMVYDIDETGRIEVPDGPYNYRFYRNGTRVWGHQLVEYNGDYYYLNNSLIFTSGRLYLGETIVAGTDLKAGTYTFDADGKLLRNTGIQDGYLYIDGLRQPAYQLMEFEGYYYFISDHNKLATNVRLYLDERFLKNTDFPNAVYEFDSEGRMITGTGIYNYSYYINGIRQPAYQMIEFEGDYYFISDGSKFARSTRLYLAEKFVKDFGLLEGFYSFDENGKMIPKEKVILPDFTGMTRAAAGAQLNELGLLVSITEQPYDLSIAPGTVVSQGIAAGTEVMVDSLVTLAVGGEPQTATVPDFNGMTPAEAEAAAREANFRVTYAEGFDPTRSDVAITSQTPAAGSSLLQGQTIILDGEVSLMGPLTVAAKNVAIFEAGAAADYAMYEDVFAEMDADIVSMIRVDDNANRTGNVNQVQKVAEEAGYPYYHFGKLLDLTSTDSTTGEVTDTGDYGVGIMSKYPILENSTALFTAQDTDYETTGSEARGYIRSVVDLGPKNATVYTTWLSYYSEDCRKAQLAEILETAQNDENVIIMGTFYSIATTALQEILPEGFVVVGANMIVSSDLAPLTDTKNKTGYRSSSLTPQSNRFLYAHLLFAGDDQPETVTVPNFAGMSKEEAQAAAQAAGLEINILNKPDSTKTAEQIYAQSAAAGSLLVKDKGGVTLYYSKDYSDYLNVVSYNIKCAYYGTSWAGVIENLQSVDADIIGLQECDDGTNRSDATPGDFSNQVQQLAYDMGYEYWYFAKTIDTSGGSYGHGVISRYPIKESTVTFFEAQDNPNTEGVDEIRNMERHVLDVNGTELIFYNTHLNGSFKDQYNEVMAAIEKDYADGKYVLLTGDFNIAYRGMKGYLNTDHFLALNGNENLAYGISNATTIDNIIISKNITDYYMDDVTRIGVKYLDIEREDSDHPMIYSQIKLPQAS